MILHLDPAIGYEKARDITYSLFGRILKKEGHFIVVLSSTATDIPESFSPYVKAYWTMPTDMQLSSRQYKEKTTEIRIGDTYIGGDRRNTLMMAGPCSVESYGQMDSLCSVLQNEGVKVLRGGCFKPRTSPYTFSGLGSEGLRLMAEMRKKYGFLIASEVRDASHAEEVIDTVDIVQIGTKSMFDQALLSACGKCGKPVILKRSFGATLQEFVNCADFLIAQGNDNVILCERGIRSFEHSTRFTLDLCGVEWLKQHCNLPVIVDPSHAMGARYGVPGLARAAMAAGIDGLLIETHPEPEKALSDSPQQLSPEEFSDMMKSLRKVAKAMDKNMI